MLVALPDDATARGERRRQPSLDVLACDRYVDVHRVPQRLGLVERLHPDRRTVPERVDAVVVGHRRIAEHGAPETDVHRIWLRGDRELHLLDRCAVGDRAVRRCDLRDGPRQVDMPRFELPEVTGQAHREGGIDDRQQRPRSLEAVDRRNVRGQPRRLADGSDLEDGRRAAVQHDPVIDAVGGEELPPALLAHARPPVTRLSTASGMDQRERASTTSVDASVVDFDSRRARLRSNWTLLRTASANALVGVRVDIAMMRTPDGHGKLDADEVPYPGGDQPASRRTRLANTLGLRSIMFAVDDIDARRPGLRARGAELSARWGRTR